VFFFVLPWGHDQPVYERPWLTFGLIAICTIVLCITWSQESRADREIDDAITHVASVLEEHPDARVRLSVQGAPQRIADVLAPLVETKADRIPTSGDAALEVAVRELVTGLNHVPAFRYGFQPAAPRIDRAFTHLWVHAGLFHLFGNMLFLFLAGGVLECFWHRGAYAALYFASGLAGLAAHALSAPDSYVPIVGASGAIAGLLGAFVVGYPRTRIKVAWFALLFFQPLWGVWRVPAWVLIPIWAGLELFHATYAGEDAGVAHWAHVGGFVCGALVAVIARATNLVATDAGRSDAGPHDRAAAPSPRPASSIGPRVSIAAQPAPSVTTARASTAPLEHELPVPPAAPPPPRHDRPLDLDSLPPPSDDDVIER
jgi:membrane associated rhomboid family serine protease